ncbi:hypothetical protein [Paenibacillus eucommiae]|uniref:Uncharacterized protein n=1 Tax=Paenibacillus eucommiae TaxID=1355755 RepID=A0ABS4IPB9_9BACL|nr:hypothetical protein [Paenibacillus eucommiae]MBP1988469.1 hypothetical protein [Paenibacillus eucommiae]
MMLIDFENTAITDIPWQRLTTPYGRGSDLPRLMADRQYDEIAQLVEHQSTLWQVTPWVLSFLLRELKKKQPQEVALFELKLYSAVADSFIGNKLGSAPHVERPALLLDESYLWPENDDEDELLWEEQEPPGYAELPFSSYYYYSDLLLKEAIPDFKRLQAGNTKFSAEVAELLAKLEPDGSE